MGAAMLSPRAIEAAADVLRPGDFYRHSHQTVWDTILVLHAEGVAVDAITLADRLDRDGTLEGVGGRERIHEIATLVPAAGAAGHHAGVIRRAAIRRGLVTAGGQIAALGWNADQPEHELVDHAEQMVFALADTDREASGLLPVKDGLGDTWARLEAVAAEGRAAGLPTGIRDVDRLLAGLHPGNLVVVAARPAMGKSAYALGLCAHVALRLAKPAAFFTLEMGRDEIQQRLLSMEGRVDSQAMRHGELAGDDWTRMGRVANDLQSAPLFVDDTSLLTIADIRGKARRLAARHPLALIVVDYLQLISATGRVENRNQEIAQISRSLKILAGELHVPVVVVSQLSRKVEERHDKRPMLSDLRESGAIEQDADVVIALYRDAYYNPEDAAEMGTEGTAELIVLKHRNGPTGTVNVAFVDRYTTFGDLAREPNAASRRYDP